MFIELITFVLFTDLFSLSSSFLDKNYLIKESPQNRIENGGARDVVLLCYNEQGDLSIVLKWFFDKYRYDNELRCFQTLKALDLQFSKIPDVLFTKEALYNEQSIYLIAQSAAKGYPLTDLTEEAATAVGRALSELHAKSMRNEEVDYSFLLERLEKIRSDYPPFKTLIEPLKHIYSIFSEEQHPASFIHGDTHPGNIFYDNESKDLTFIDFGCSGFFYPANDFAEFYFTNKSKGDILQAFIDSYTFPITELEKTFGIINFMIMACPDFSKNGSYKDWWLSELEIILQSH